MRAEPITNPRKRVKYLCRVGDTIVGGAMGLAMAAGLDLPAAMRLANAAAGVVVAKLEQQFVRLTELAETL